MDEMRVIDFVHDDHYAVGEWVFDSLVFLEFREKEYIVHTSLKD